VTKRATPGMDAGERLVERVRGPRKQRHLARLLDARLQKATVQLSHRTQISGIVRVDRDPSGLLSGGHRLARVRLVAGVVHALEATADAILAEGPGALGGASKLTQAVRRQANTPPGERVDRREDS
jgi:hypothetical protein